jgi:hypothetical protein
MLAWPLHAQTAPVAPEAPDAPIVVLTSALYNDQANLKEAIDSSRAGVATEVVRTRLRERMGAQVLPYEATDSAATSPMAYELGGGVPCNVKVSCAIAVARDQGARWVVLTKVSKTSNLIWLLSAQLIRVANSEIILDDSTELKGEPESMIRVGMRIFADRVARTVQDGGVANNFPGQPEFQ